MNSQTILLVDDNSSEIDLAERALARNYIINRLVVARDGWEALDFLLLLVEANGGRIAERTILRRVAFPPCIG